MAPAPSFRSTAVVACGTLRPELERLRDDGFLDCDNLLFTAPGLHEEPKQLEEQLDRVLAKALETCSRAVVAYGDRCYIDPAKPEVTADVILTRHRKPTTRVQALNCIDMLADADQRRDLAEGRKVYWLTPGWVRHWKYIFRKWDVGLANETFPQHDVALVLDGVAFLDQYAAEHPEELLEFSDWMKIGIEPCDVSLDRLKGLLTDCLHRLPGLDQT